MYGVLNAELSRMTSLGVGGRAKRLLVAERPEEICEGVILGLGTNVLVSDAGLDVVVRPAIRGIRLTADGLWAGGGEPLPKVAAFAAGKGLTGLEWASGIPGTVGGAVFGNAGAFGCSVARSLVYCQTADRLLKPDACGFGMRTSGIGGVVTGACFKVRPGDAGGIRATTAKYDAFRRATQPRGRTAGSTFKGADKPAGWYLERAGLKGERVGGAHVSELHANFILTERGATAADVYRLIARMKARVKDAFGVELEEEIRFLGDFSGCF